MIVSESDVLLAALDRRLQVDRVDALEALLPLAGRDGSAASGAPVPERGQAAAEPGTRDAARTGAATTSASAAAAPRDGALVEHLPLGQIVAARVVDVPGPRQVVADVGSLRLALSWPSGNGQVPQTGDPLTLRVLALSPMLLFEDVRAATVPARDDDGTTRLSMNALRLQAPAGGAGPIRFTAPMLIVEATVEEATRGAGDGSASALAQASTPSNTASAASIALDDIIVGAASVVERDADAVGSPATTGSTGVVASGPPIDPALVMPLVLQGPAWSGQDVELVVRRERADEAFDNAVLDQWCGELVIDLPNLGRVAGHLAWSMQGLRVRLEGQDAGSVSSMSGAAAELAAGLAEVALPVLSLSVGQLFADTALGAGLPRRGFGE